MDFMEEKGLQSMFPQSGRWVASRVDLVDVILLLLLPPQR